MEFIFHPYVVNSILAVVSLYIVTATIFWLTVKLKDDEGNMWIDSDSLHFKIAYPIRRHSWHFQETIKDGVVDIGLCQYFTKLFFTLYFGWPVIIALQFFKAIIGIPIFFIFGSYFNPFDLSPIQDNPWIVELKKYPLPRVRGKRILPAYIVLPIVYVYFWTIKGDFYSEMLTLHIWILALLAVVLSMTTIVGFYDYTKRKVGDYKRMKRMDQNPKEVGLVRAYLKYREMCPILKIK